MVTIWNYYNAISCEQSTWSRILEAINLSLSEVITWKKSKKRNQTSQRSSGRHPSPAGRSIAGWSRRQICRTGKEKATLEAEIARLREVHSQKLSKEAQKLMKMPFQRAITKKSRLIWASWKKCSRTGGCAPNDRAGPWNRPARDDRVLKDCVLSSFLVAVITASHHYSLLLAHAGACFRDRIYITFLTLYIQSPLFF